MCGILYSRLLIGMVVVGYKLLGIWGSLPTYRTLPNHLLYVPTYLPIYLPSTYLHDVTTNNNLLVPPLQGACLHSNVYVAYCYISTTTFGEYGGFLYAQ